MSAYRFSESFFFSTGASKAEPSIRQSDRVEPDLFDRAHRDAHRVLHGDYLPGLSAETTHIE